MGLFVFTASEQPTGILCYAHGQPYQLGHTPEEHEAYDRGDNPDQPDRKPKPLACSVSELEQLLDVSEADEDRGNSRVLGWVVVVAGYWFAGVCVHHRATIYRKLGVHNAKGAVKAPRERGLIGGANEWSDKPTQTQLDLLHELSVGGTQREIADRLGLTVDSVKSLIKRMSAKLRTANTQQLLSFAAEKRWLD